MTQRPLHPPLPVDPGQAIPRPRTELRIVNYWSDGTVETFDDLVLDMSADNRLLRGEVDLDYPEAETADWSMTAGGVDGQDLIRQGRPYLRLAVYAPILPSSETGERTFTVSVTPPTPDTRRVP